MPHWLTLLATLSLIISAVCAALILLDIAAGHRRPMKIMNVVWPVTGLYAGPPALWFYCRRPYGR